MGGKDMRYERRAERGGDAAHPPHVLLCPPRDTTDRNLTRAIWKCRLVSCVRQSSWALSAALLIRRATGVKRMWR